MCLNAKAEKRYDGESETFVTHTLRSEGFDASEDGTGRGTPLVPVHVDSIAPTLRSASSNPASHGKQNGTDRETLVAYQCHGTNVGPMGAIRQGNGHATGGVPFIVRTSAAGQAAVSDQAAALINPTDSSYQFVQDQMAVRRLTPRECERLQGFHDDWTRYGHDGKEISDSARYRMLGNAVTVPVIEWLGKRIIELV